MLGELGGDEGSRRGAPPGEGATLHCEGGAPDIENTQPQELQNLRGQGRLAPGEAGSPQGGRWTWLAALAATLAVLLAILLAGAAVYAG